MSNPLDSLLFIGFIVPLLFAALELFLNLLAAAAKKSPVDRKYRIWFSKNREFSGKTCTILELKKELHQAEQENKPIYDVEEIVEGLEEIGVGIDLNVGAISATLASFFLLNSQTYRAPDLRNLAVIALILEFFLAVLIVWISHVVVDEREVRWRNLLMIMSISAGLLSLFISFFILGSTQGL